MLWACVCSNQVTSALLAEFLTQALVQRACTPPRVRIVPRVCYRGSTSYQVTSALLAEFLTRNKALRVWACICKVQVTSALLAEFLTRNKALRVWACICKVQVTSAL